jgi:hypothetical protein
MSLKRLSVHIICLILILRLSSTNFKAYQFLSDSIQILDRKSLQNHLVLFNFNFNLNSFYKTCNADEHSGNIFASCPDSSSIPRTYLQLLYQRLYEKNV